MQAAGWHIEIEFDEDETRTRAAALLRLRDGSELRARGHARRSPEDPVEPRIGEEVAGARALHELAQKLLEKAEGEVEAGTHRPAHIKG